VTSAGTVTVSTTPSEHLNIATSGIHANKSVNRYWTLTAGAPLAFTSYSPTFTFVAADVDAGATTSAFVVKRFDGTNWNATTTGTRTATTTQATGVTAMSDFAIGEPDLTGPVTSSVSIVPTPTKTAPTVSAQVSDSTTGANNVTAAEYFIDVAGSPGTGTAMNATDASFNSPTENVTKVLGTDFGPLSDGQHTVYIRGRDAGGNWGAVNSANFVKDTTGPTTTINFPADGATYNTAGWNAGCVAVPGICGTASDPSGFSNTLVSVRRASDGKYWTGLSWVVSASDLYEPVDVAPPNWRYNLATSALTDGDSYTVHAKSTDAVSNIGDPASASFTYDTTAPTVTVEQASGQSDPTNAQPIHFTATFSEPVTGFAANDVSVGGTAGHGSATVNITPGLGNAYDIAVGNLSSDGTVMASIAAARVQDAGANGNPAASADNSVTLDQANPQSHADSPAFSNAGATTIPVDYTASDNAGGTGLDKVELWAKKDSGAWTLADTDNSPGISGSFVYTPSGDGTYRFYTIAVDNAGNREAIPTEVDAVTVKADTTTLRDTVAPDPMLSAPPANTNDATPVIAGTAGTQAADGSHSADDDHVAVKVFDGTTLLQTHASVPVNASTGAFSVSADHLDDGSYIARVDQSDAAGNSGFDESDFEIDTVRPDVTIDEAPLTQPDPTNDQPIHFTAHFSEPVTGFDEDDVTLGGSAGSASATVTVTPGIGNRYDVAVSGLDSDGTLTASIPADGASDAAGNGSTESTSSDNEVTFDTTPADVTVEQAAGQDDPTNDLPIHFTAQFSEPVTGFTSGDVDLGGSAGHGSATVTLTPGTGNSYDIAVDGLDSDGTLTASIGNNAVEEAAQNGNTESTSDDNEVTYDATVPTVAVEQAAGQDDPTSEQPINFTAEFSEPVTGFDEDDVALQGTVGLGSATVTVTGSGASYNIAVSGLGVDGALVADVPAGGASDAAGNANDASTSVDNIVIYDTTRPDVSVEQKAGQADPTNDQPINFTVAFSESVSGFDEDDVTLGGAASAGSPTVVVTETGGGGGVYNVAVSGLTSDGKLTADVEEDGAEDAAGNRNTASTSSDNEVTFDTTPADVTVEQAAGQVDPTNEQPIHFTAQFSEPVTGFTSGDVDLGGSAGHGSATVTVTPGTGNSYDIAVEGLDSDGTLTASIGSNAVDEAAQNGNTESTSTDNAVLYDGTDPESEASSPAFSNAGATTIPVDWTASDNATGSGLDKVELWAKKDGGSWALADTDNSPAVSGQFVYTPSGDGTYRFYTIATDHAGNREAVQMDTVTVTIVADTTTLRDTVAPEPSMSAPPANTNDDTPEIAGTAGTQDADGSHSADNDHVTVRVFEGTTLLQTHSGVSVDGTTGSFSVDAEHLDDGTYTARVDQSDAAGNGGFDEREFDVDTIRPDVTVEQAAGQDDPTNTQPIHFTAEFSEPVTGFDETDVTLGGSAGSGSATVTVTPGAGNTYDIEVDGLSSDGTLTAEVPADGASDAAGNGNTTSTSEDNEVTYDATAPTVTVEQASGQDDPTNSQPIHFTAEFTEPVTGFTSGDVDLGGSAGHGSATVTVTPGTGNSYDIAVAGLDSDGTLTAEVPADGAFDAAGNGNTASTSSDNQVRLDRIRPQSQASAPATTNETADSFEVTYHATDDSTALVKVELYASKDGGSYSVANTDNSPVEDGSFDFEHNSDGTYRFYTIATDAAGNVEKAPTTPPDDVTIVEDAKTLRDTVAPNVSLSAPPPLTNDDTPEIAGTAGTQAAQNDAAADDDHVTVEVLDDADSVVQTLSGVAVDGLTGAFSVDAGHLADGDYTARATQQDGAGNADSDVRGFRVDTVAPDAPTIDSGPEDPTNETTAEFEFTAAESGGTLECKLDAGGYEECVSPKSYDELGEGDHSFSVRQVDAAGNESDPDSFDWFVDLTAPETSFGSTPPDPDNDTTPTFTFSGTDNHSDAGDLSFECKLDDGDWYSCSSPEQLTGVDEGTHTLRVRATDEAGNIDASPADFSWYVDLTAPDTAFESGPDNPTNSDSASFEFSGTDDHAAPGDLTFECKLDDGDWYSCSSPEELTDLEDGTHSLLVRATDDAGNTDAVPDRFDWTIDTVKPHSHATSPATTNDTANTFDVDYTASDDRSGLDSVELWVNKNGGPYTLANTDDTPGATGTFAFHHDGDGTYRFYTIATDEAGNVEGVPLDVDDVTVVVEDAKTLRDTVAPTVSLSAPPSSTNDDTPEIAGTAGTQAAQNDAAADDDHVTVEVLDDADSVVQTLSGVAVDGLTGAFSVDAGHLADGDYTARATQQDGAGNADSDVRGFRVDTVAPDAPTIDSGPEDPTNETTAEFEFTAAESGGTLECKLDAGGYEECVSPKSYDELGEGDHSFSVRQVDAAGNESDPDSFDWFVDLTAPETSFGSTPPDPDNDTTPTFTFSGTDNHSAPAALDFACNVDNLGWNPCSSPETLAALTDGSHTFQVRATDEAGNTDATPASYVWTVDTGGPGAPNITAGPDDPTNSNAATFEWTGAESGGTFLCKVDAAPFALCTSPEPYGAISEGHHKFSVRQVDAAGNAGAIAEYEWDTDYTAPQTGFDSTPPDPDNDSTPTFAFSGTDNHSGPAALHFACNVDGLGWNPCSSPKTLAALSEGSHTLQVRATDEAGNTDGTPASYTWTVDSLAPGAPAISTPAEGSFHATTSITVTGTAEAGSTVEIFDGAASLGTTTANGSGNWTKNVTLGGTGERSLTAKATDTAHNTSGASAVRKVVVDTTAPQSQASGPATSSTTAINLAYTASDNAGGSGLGSVQLWAKGPSDASFALVQTDATPNTTQSFSYTAGGNGTYAFYTRAVDGVGNTEAAPATPDVSTVVTTGPPPPVFTFTGFFRPIDNMPVVNEAKAGSNIPVKFSLGGNKGLNIFAADYPKSQAVPCNSAATVDGIEATSGPGASVLSYDSGSQTYQYNWKTDKAWLGCRQLVLKFVDGSYARANFKFK
jgi:predicted Rdx family selenoprotein